MAGAVLLSWATFSFRLIRAIRSATRASGNRWRPPPPQQPRRRRARSASALLPFRVGIDREVSNDVGGELDGLHRLARPRAHAGDRHGPGRDPGVASGQEAGVAHAPPRDLRDPDPRLELVL